MYIKKTMSSNVGIAHVTASSVTTLSHAMSVSSDMPSSNLPTRQINALSAVTTATSAAKVVALNARGGMNSASALRYRD